MAGVSDPITLRELHGYGLESIKGIGDRKREALGEFGISNVLDLVTLYPRRWVDRTNEARVQDLQPGAEALVLVTVRSVEKRTTRNRRTMVTAVVGDGTGRFTVTFFNQPWRERQLRTDLTISLFGKPEVYRGGLQMTNPIVDLIGDRTGRIVPIYPQSEKVALTTWEMAAFIETALRKCEARGILDPVPAEVRQRFKVIGRHEAIRSIHLPETMAEKEIARRRLAFDELLRVQLLLVGRKRAWERDAKGIRHVVNPTPDLDLVARFRAALPYALTGAQERTIREIAGDLAGPHPMHRLLQGDVGAGKTVVALSTLLVAIQGGFQGALMAPTEVLAEQHAAGVRRLLQGVTVPDPGSLFGDRPLRVELLANRVTGAERRDILAGLADGSVDLVIGTHALIQEGVRYQALGAVVIDEQHRFGVEQRAALRAKGESENPDGAVPDVLVMTATPIPRTAAMTVYGDLDVSVLDELPPGRTPIVTRWANGPATEDQVWADVIAEVKAGRQAYVVCPLIDESEKLEVASAEETFERLHYGELAGLRLGLLHGRLPSAEKDAVMERFRRGELDVLIATTVIEVGVDVPNATVMVILDADRFGIAQLHQLRGRVGRGADRSRCWLVTAEQETNPRVEALVASTDGFALAEVDLDLRGEGTIMNTAQKGRSDLKLASLRRDRELVLLARQAAEMLIADDPDLTGHRALRDELDLLLSAEDEEFLFKG